MLQTLKLTKEERVTMSKLTNKPLESAKDRLRNSLAQLENIVEQALQQSRKNPAANQSASPAAEKELKLLQEENRHLREEIQTLQAQVGKEQQKAAKYKKLNEDAAQKVDRVLVQMKQVAGV